MNKATAISILLAATILFGACGDKQETAAVSSSSAAAARSEVTTDKEGSAAADANTAADVSTSTDISTSADTDPAAEAAGSGQTAAGGNGQTTAGGNNRTAAGGNGESAATTRKVTKPLKIDEAYRLETEEELYSRTIQGVYLLTDLQDKKIENSKEKIAAKEAEGKPMYVEFFGNGTLREHIFDDSVGGTWDMEKLRIGADTIPYTLKGDTLTMTDKDVVMTFSRTTQEKIDQIQAPPQKETASAADTDADEIDTLIAENDFHMGVIGYDKQNPYGFGVRVRCENYSYQNLRFSITDAVVNDCMFEPSMEEDGQLKDHWYIEVPAGETVVDEIIFRSDKAEEYGISEVEKIALRMSVMDLDYFRDYPNEEDAEIYVTDKAAQEGVKPAERRKTTKEKTIADDSKFTFVILGGEEQPDGSYVLKAYIENKSYMDLMFSWDDAYVNGILLDPFWNKEVLSGSRCYEDIIFRAEDLKANGVGYVSSIKFTMSVCNSRDWLSYNIYSETSDYRP